jgi:hypothetical protein
MSASSLMHEEHNSNPSNEIEWNVALKGQDTARDQLFGDDSSEYHSLDGSKRSSSTNSSCRSPYPSFDSETNHDENKKKKKSKKKSKRKKGKDANSKKRKKKKDKFVDDDDNETTVTERDEHLVKELCTFFSKTLSTKSNKESFLKMLQDDFSQGKQFEREQSGFYSSLQSPEPSVCGSQSSSISRKDHAVSQRKELKRDWTSVDPPSIATTTTSSILTSPSNQPKPSIRGPGSNIFKALAVGAPNGDILSPDISVSTMKLSNCQSRVLREKFQDLNLGLNSQKTDLDQETSGPVTDSRSLAYADVPKAESSTSEIQMSPQGSFSDVSSPEELFLALPTEFRSYLLGLHESEGQNQDTAFDAQDSNDNLVSKCITVPTDTHRDQDTVSVISEISGVTGMLSQVSGHRFMEGHVNFSKSTSSSDDSSDDSEDSDDDSDCSDQHVKKNSQVLRGLSWKAKKPRRSSIASSFQVKRKNSTTRCRKIVRFDNVHVREFNTILDNNPAVTEGPAIALGWNILQETTHLVAEHDNGRHRRYGDALMLSSHTREGILFKMGYSKEDIGKMVTRIYKAQQERRRTVQKVRVQNLEFAMERLGNSFRSLLQRTGSSRKTPLS